MRIDRILVLLVGLGYVGVYVAVVLGGGHTIGPEMIFVLLFVLVPVLMVWYGDELGEISSGMTGLLFTSRRQPGWVFKLAGWFFLLAPLIILAIALAFDLPELRRKLLGEP